MTGTIMRISRLRMGTDGEGVTTLVAFADCPLSCRYCINDFCHKNKLSRYRVAVAEYEPKELVDLLAKDDIYYKMSNGGVTFGGGEPLLYAPFIADVCMHSDPNWNMRIETSLNVPWYSVEILIDKIDEWIIDIKDMDPEIYKAYTGISQEQMQNNLRKLLERVPQDRILVRVPNIPYYNNQENMKESIKTLTEMGVVRLDAFRYTM